MQEEQSPSARRYLILVPWLILVGLVITWALLHNSGPASPIPMDVRSGAGFTVYYPSQAKLPSGYRLNSASFHLAQPGVVIYTIDHGNQHLVISEEKQPEGNVAADFTKNYIPLHTPLDTKYGQAQIGANGSASSIHTIVSLLIKNGPWLIITAPSDISHTDVKSIIEALRR